jgi:hypothetical protein
MLSFFCDIKIFILFNVEMIILVSTEYSSRPVNLPEAFPFPFKPYDIQEGFMRELYTCLEQGRVGIFESPTGTVFCFHNSTP